MEPIVSQSPCELGLARALVVAQEIADGMKTPISGALILGQIMTVDCFDFMNEGHELVDALGTFVDLVDQWEILQDRASERDRINEEITVAVGSWLRLVPGRA